MSTNLSILLQEKITKVLHPRHPLKLSNVLKGLKLKHEKSNEKFYYKLPVQSKYYDIRDIVPDLLETKPDKCLEYIEIDKNNSKTLNFQFDKDSYIKELLESLAQKVKPPNFMCKTPNNVLIEFSSPNIAKPFHLGHLRSTMIGNYIANLNCFFKNDVKKINYLGDWGTQFGFVQLGLSLCKISDEALKKDPIRVLYNAYVHANSLAETNIAIADQAREIFTKLENGDETSFEKWNSLKKYTVEELKKTYSRIGVTFDEYEWESTYSMNKIRNIICEIERLNLISTDSYNRKVICLDTKNIVPIIKSDGSSLYITRDIAAANSRFEKYQFDKMYYVVDNAQTKHFNYLIKILHAMQLPWANRLQHIKFGKIRGMSTRKGTAVFLQDILDETRNLMIKKQSESPTTKVNLNLNDPSSEILSVSAVIINDFKYKRNQDYIFDWDQALSMDANSGVSLQYTHCRLVSLEENSGATIASECIPSLLIEPEAQNLIYIIGKFDETVIKSYEDLEPYILVYYLFQLRSATNKALKVLRIKGESRDLANQRLLLMHVSRQILAKGLELLGITPLNKM